MRVKAILNRLQKQPGFVYDTVRWSGRRAERPELHVTVRARRGSQPVCSGCGVRRPCYDRLRLRLFQFVPLWAMAVFFLYAPRRADCPRCGVTVELLPWAVGKSPVTTALAWFLASWAKALSWQETARRFGTSWHVVFTAVRHAVLWVLPLTASAGDVLTPGDGHCRRGAGASCGRWPSRSVTARCHGDDGDWAGSAARVGGGRRACLAEGPGGVPVQADRVVAEGVPDGDCEAVEGLGEKEGFLGRHVPQVDGRAKR